MKPSIVGNLLTAGDERFILSHVWKYRYGGGSSITLYFPRGESESVSFYRYDETTQEDVGREDAIRCLAMLDEHFQNPSMVVQPLTFSQPGPALP